MIISQLDFRVSEKDTEPTAYLVGKLFQLQIIALRNNEARYSLVMFNHNGNVMLRDSVKYSGDLLIKLNLLEGCFGKFK
jgi:hypothetical protein